MGKDERIVNSVETLLASLAKAGLIAGRDITVDDLASALAKAPITTMATSIEASADKEEQDAKDQYNLAMAKVAADRRKAVELRKSLSSL